MPEFTLLIIATVTFVLGILEYSQGYSSLYGGFRTSQLTNFTALEYNEDFCVIGITSDDIICELNPCYYHISKMKSDFPIGTVTEISVDYKTWGKHSPCITQSLSEINSFYGFWSLIIIMIVFLNLIFYIVERVIKVRMEQHQQRYSPIVEMV